jgi:hypothetical protein
MARKHPGNLQQEVRLMTEHPIHTQNTIHSGDLLVKTYSLYRQRFWTLFRMALLPAVVAYLVHSLIREAAPRFLPGRRTAVFWFYLASLGWLQNAIYWSISAFFFAAVAANVLVPAEEELPVADAFTCARERLRPVIGVALLSWFLFSVGSTAAGLALIPLVPGRIQSKFWIFVIVGTIYLLVGGLVSRFGAAIPALINDPSLSFRKALRVSLKTMENWEPFFMFFLAKSALLGYGFYWMGDYLLNWLWDSGALTGSTYPWVSQLLYISIAAAIESPLFIAFSLLYRESALPRQQYASAAAIE